VHNRTVLSFTHSEVLLLMTTYSRKNSFALLGIACLLTGSLSTLSLTYAQSPTKALSPVKDTKPFSDKEPLLLTTSVKRVQAFVKKRKAEEAKEKVREKKTGKKEEKESKLDYYDAWLARISQRAYPNDTIDDAAYANSLNRRPQMSSATRFFGQNTSSIQASTFGSGTLAPPPPPPPDSVQWEFIGPKNLILPQYISPAAKISGRVGGLAYDPNNVATIYLAASAGGVWKTTDGGVTWLPISGLSDVPYMSSITTHPTDGQIVYAGTGDYDGQIGSGVGILYSTDGGANWLNVGRAEMQRTAVSGIVVDPDTPQNVVAATGHGTVTSYLWYSINGGLNWTRGTISGAGASGDWSSVQIAKPQSTGGIRYYYATSEGNNYGLWRSADKGRTWVSVAPPAGGGSREIRIATSATDANTIYIVRGGDQKVFKGVRSTTTDTYTWTDITTGITASWGQSWYDMHIGVGATNRTGTKQDALYIGLISLAEWVNGTWKDVGRAYQSSPNLHPDQHCMAFFPGNNDIMVVGHDGGVDGMSYSNAASSVVFDNTLNKTLGLTMFYSGAFHPSDPTRLLGGAQDNSTPISQGDLANWKNVAAGDGCGTALNPVNPLIQYSSSQYLGMYRTTNSWSSSNGFAPSWGGDNVPFVGYMSVDPTAPNPLYVGTNYLWRWNENTGRWDARLGNQQMSNGYIRAITVAPSDNKVIYTGTTDGNLWMTSNSGTTWRTVMRGLPNRVITDISVHPTNPSNIIVSIGGTGSGHVYQCPNTAAGIPIYTDKSGSGPNTLPDVQHNSITRDPSSPDTNFFVGSDQGVFATVDGGATWANATETLGLPVCEISTLRAVPGTGYLMATTYGRGAWRLPLGSIVIGTPAKIEASTASFVRNGNTLVGTLTLKNTGTSPAVDVRLRSTTIVVGQRIFALTNPALLPINVGNIAGGQSVKVNVTYQFDSRIPAGTSATLRTGVRLGTSLTDYNSSVTLRIP
jgi:hypothetical protein